MLGGNRHYHHDTKAILPSAENIGWQGYWKTRLRAAHEQVVLH
ncbi:hypothetical protein [Xenorhabdus bovienii]|nr:hypothetical protein [Xenorhabdus bovienii]